MTCRAGAAGSGDVDGSERAMGQYERGWMNGRADGRWDGRFTIRSRQRRAGAGDSMLAGEVTGAEQEDAGDARNAGDATGLSRWRATGSLRMLRYDFMTASVLRAWRNHEMFSRHLSGVSGFTTVYDDALRVYGYGHELQASTGRARRRLHKLHGYKSRPRTYDHALPILR